MDIFPNNLYRFVYSNFDIMPKVRIAKFLGCTTKNIAGIAADMGLPELPLPPRERAVPMVIRRNWFLIPRNEIARLLGITKETLARILLEMDFLDINCQKSFLMVCELKLRTLLILRSY